jgi:hypothetical protein
VASCLVGVFPKAKVFKRKSARPNNERAERQPSWEGYVSDSGNNRPGGLGV